MTLKSDEAVLQWVFFTPSVRSISQRALQGVRRKDYGRLRQTLGSLPPRRYPLLPE